MKYTDIKKHLREYFSVSDVSSDLRLHRRSKDMFFEKLSEFINDENEKRIFSSLKSFYRKSASSSEIRIKNLVLSEIEKTTYEDHLYSFFHLFARKVFALSLVSIFIFVVLLSPLIRFSPENIFYPVRAAYLECQGVVYINGLACLTGVIRNISPGDHIVTDDASNATIFYADYSLIRLDPSTDAYISPESEELLHVRSGDVWVRSLSDSSSSQDSIHISTPFLRAKIPRGAAGFTTRSYFTQLVSDTAVVEVQIDSDKGKTELVSLSPDRSVSVRKSRSFTRVVESRISPKRVKWVELNSAKDTLYLDKVKNDITTKKASMAGVLPGGVSDYVGKLAQSARTAITFDADVKLSLRLQELDELFSETLLLFKKGDQTMAEQNFEAYRYKFSSLIDDSSDRLSSDERSSSLDQYIALLKDHSRLVSPFSNDDPQYVLKSGIEDMILNLDISTIDESHSLSDSIYTSKLLEAHSMVSNGDIGSAKKILKDTISIENDPSKLDHFDTSSLPILSDISNKSDELKPLVSKIKQIQVDIINSQEPQITSRDIVSSVVLGTAVRDNDDVLPEDDISFRNTDSDDHMMSKVVGQAIKEDLNNDTEEVKDFD